MLKHMIYVEEFLSCVSWEPICPSIAVVLILAFRSFFFKEILQARLRHFRITIWPHFPPWCSINMEMTEERQLSDSIPESKMRLEGKEYLAKFGHEVWDPFKNAFLTQ